MNFQTIFNDVFKQCLKDAEQFYIQGLKTLIVDDFTVQLVAQMTTQTYLAYKEIALTQLITKAVSMHPTPHSSAIVFVAPSQQNLSLLCDILKSSKQKFAHMYLNFTQNITDWQIQQLATADVNRIIASIKIQFFSYKPILPNLCLIDNAQQTQINPNQSFINNLATLFLSLGDQPWSIRYQNGSDIARNLSYELQRELTANSSTFLKLQQQQNKASSKIKKVPIEIIFIDQNLNQLNTMENSVSFAQLLEDRCRLIENNNIVKLRDKNVSFGYFTLAPQTQAGLMGDCYQVQQLFKDIKAKQTELMQTKDLSVEEQMKRLEAHREQQQQQNEIFGFGSFITSYSQYIQYNFILATIQRDLAKTDIFEIAMLQTAKKFIEEKNIDNPDERIDTANLFALGLVPIIQRINGSSKMNGKKKQAAYDAINTFLQFLVQYCNSSQEIQSLAEKVKQTIGRTIIKQFNWNQIEADAKNAATIFQQNNIGKQFIADTNLLSKSDESPPPVRWNVLNIIQAALQNKLSVDLFPIIEQMQNSHLQLEQSGQVPLIMLCSLDGFSLAEITETYLWDQDGSFSRAVQQRGIFITNKVNSPQEMTQRVLQKIL